MAIRTMSSDLVDEVESTIGDAIDDEFGGELDVKFLSIPDPDQMAEDGTARIVVEVKPKAFGR